MCVKTQRAGSGEARHALLCPLRPPSWNWRPLNSRLRASVPKRLILVRPVVCFLVDVVPGSRKHGLQCYYSRRPGTFKAFLQTTCSSFILAKHVPQVKNKRPNAVSHSRKETGSLRSKRTTSPPLFLLCTLSPQETLFLSSFQSPKKDRRVPNEQFMA